MPRSAEQILELLDQRTENGRSRQFVLNEMAALYHGRITVPLPELSREEKPAIANHVMQAIEQMAQRLSSVQPELRTFARPSQGTDGRASAAKRRRVFQHFAASNADTRLASTEGRWLAAYASAPSLVLPDFVGSRRNALNGPRWMLMDPRGFYPDIDSTDPTNPVKEDAIFHTTKKLGWMRRLYPEHAARISSPNSRPDDEVDWVVYVDHEQIHTLASASVRAHSPAGDMTMAPRRRTVTIDRMVNLTGHPLVVAPGGLSLTSEPMGRYDQIIGMYQRMAEIDALSRIALKKSIFSDAWVVSNPGETGRVVQGPVPLQGQPGIVAGGRIEFRNIDPQFSARVGIGDLERAIHLTGRIPSEFGGELPTNARTARQGGRLLSNLIDFDLAEMQRVLEEGKEWRYKISAMTDKAFFGGFSKTIEIDNGASQHEITYDPAELWTTFGVKVSYRLGGSDAEASVIGAGQRMGMGTLSRESFMEVDPMVTEVELEKDRITAEAVEQAFLARIQQEANLPEAESSWSATDYAEFGRIIRDDEKDLYDAYADVNEAAAQRRAELAQAAQEGSLTPTQAQPGVDGEVPPAIAGPSESGQNLTRLLGQLRLAERTAPGEIPVG